MNKYLKLLMLQPLFLLKNLNKIKNSYLIGFEDCPVLLPISTSNLFIYMNELDLMLKTFELDIKESHSQNIKINIITINEDFKYINKIILDNNLKNINVNILIENNINSLANDFNSKINIASKNYIFLTSNSKKIKPRFNGFLATYRSVIKVPLMIYFEEELNEYIIFNRNARVINKEIFNILI